jgi:aspartate kinase
MLKKFNAPCENFSTEQAERMVTPQKTIVMKFGGAAVSSPERFLSIAQIIKDKMKDNHPLVIVVSAMGDTTDELIALARKVHPTPPSRELDMLVSVGERISISLLAMALSRLGIDAVSFTGSQSGILTTEAHTDARILEVRPQRILQALNNNKIAIVAGFQGMSTKTGDITTLGRGGSDTTAVALAAALSADRVEFYKDVEGIFDADPKSTNQAKKFDQMTFASALAMTQAGAQVLQPRCIEIAEKNSIPLWVLPFETPHNARTDNLGTWIGQQECSARQRPLTAIFEK